MSWQPLMPESSKACSDQKQDKLNPKRIIHEICSIFRLFLYQINTKFVLTVSRRIHFLSSIHQHLNHAPQKKKTNKCEETWRHRDATTATLQQTRFIVIRKHFCGNSADFVRARGIFGWSRWRCWKDYRQQPTTQEEKQNLSVLKQELILS